MPDFSNPEAVADMERFYRSILKHHDWSMGLCDRMALQANDPATIHGWLKFKMKIQRSKDHWLRVRAKFRAKKEAFKSANS